jgi:tetratricopeptide (TPR) repeat protein
MSLVKRSGNGSAFLSYNRMDSDYAALLYAWLAERFGSRQIFWDRGGIDVGADYRRVLSERLGACSALVAVVGPGWRPSAWIQKEISVALRREIQVIPVLVGDATLPSREELPRGIRSLSTRQALEIRDLRFREQLISVLEPVMRTSAPDERQDRLLTQRLIRLLIAQSDRQQRDGLMQLTRNETDAAIDTFSELFEILMTLLELSPGDPTIELRLGYVYKDLAQSFEQQDPDRAVRYAASGERIFERLIAIKLPRYDRASAFNGLGNVLLIEGDAERAADWCRKAVTLVPRYGYAWNDLFRAYRTLAERGDVRLPRLREALRGLQQATRGERLLMDAVQSHSAFLARLVRPPNRSRSVSSRAGGSSRRAPAGKDTSKSRMRKVFTKNRSKQSNGNSIFSNNT